MKSTLGKRRKLWMKFPTGLRKLADIQKQTQEKGKREGQQGSAQGPAGENITVPPHVGVKKLEAKQQDGVAAEPENQDVEGNR